MDARTIADAFVYLLGRALVVRQEHADRKAEAFAYNEVRYSPPGSADFVNPNLDVAYLEGWIAVDEEHPVILDVPQVKGRYYTAQIVDEWGEVIANINERACPSKPYGKFALCKPGSAVRLRSDTTRIDLHSSKAKLLGRVELKGDPEGAVRLQQKFTLTPQGAPRITPPPVIPMFSNERLTGAMLFEQAEELMGSALDISPRAADMQQKVRAVAAYAASGATARQEVETLLRETVIPEFKAFAFRRGAPELAGWVGGPAPMGHYGSNYWQRAAANYAGIWANTPDEVIYFISSHDAAGERLDGGKSYVIDFPKDRLPDEVVDAYWSVILVDSTDFRVVKNPLNRFNLNNHSPLKRAADGSLKIALGPRAVDGVPDSNWLPSAPGRPYSLTFRTCVPKDVVKRGAWAPPGIMHVH